MKTWQLLKKKPDLFQRYFVKEYLIKACRKFFEEKNYHELESPIITDALPQERYLDVLTTEIELGNKELTGYIIPTTETFNKKILAAGLGNHFVITKVARGLEEIGANHSPEFTMLEWYTLGGNYKDLMNSTEDLLVFAKKFIELAQKKGVREAMKLSFEEISAYDADLTITFGDKKIDLSHGWNRISIPKKFEEIFGVKFSEVNTQKELFKLAQSRGYSVKVSDDWQIIFEMMFAKEIEETLPYDRPTFIFDYPKVMCPLTKVNTENPLVCEKVELYLGRKEVANGYTELLDADEQEQRFIAEQEARKKLGMKEIKFDTDLIAALRSGIPEVAGIGMGLDRVAMIFANATNISEINYFPANEMFNDESK